MIFLNSASSAAVLVFYLPGIVTHTDIEGRQRKARVGNILKSLEKNTIFNEHPVKETHFVKGNRKGDPAVLWTDGGAIETNIYTDGKTNRFIEVAVHLNRNTL